MPISPSYKKTKAPKLKAAQSGIVSTSGTYIPPKGSVSPTVYPLTEQKKLITIQTGEMIIVVYVTCDYLRLLAGVCREKQ